MDAEPHEKLAKRVGHCVDRAGSSKNEAPHGRRRPLHMEAAASITFRAACDRELERHLHSGFLGTPSHGFGMVG
jgi:hypothetical protein